jgi:phenylacetate-CoA ligase
MTQPAEWAYRDDLVRLAIDRFGRPETHFEDRYYWPPERLRTVREERLRMEIERAWNIPFYRRLWENAGFEPRQFRKLEDLARIPMYTVDDIRASIERCPPYGDYQAITPGPGRTGLRMYTSGGTTGTPRPTIYTPWDRIVGSLMVARSLHLHGFRPGDIVLNAWSYGTHNAAWVWDEALWLWIGCMPITVSTGNVTSSVKQLEMARDYGAVSILTTSDYLLHLKAVADQEGFERSDFKFRTFQTIGDVRAASEAWGVPAYDIYAFHEVQTISAECPARGGLHVWDDAFIVEVVDTETGAPVPEGEYGDLVITCLYKSGSPQIRYNIKDLSRLLSGTCACGSASTRMDHLAGRSDTMVKLRGTNVWPEAIGVLLEGAMGRHVEYFCIAYRRNERDEMAVLVEQSDATTTADRTVLTSRLSDVLSSRLGVVLGIWIVAPGELAPLTGQGSAAKLRRFKDERKGAQSDLVAKYIHS